MKRKWRQQDGGMYVEALVSLAILAIGLLPVIGAYAITPAAQRQGGQYTVALNIARGRLEVLHALSPDDFDDLASTSDVEQRGGQEYTVDRTVSPPRDEEGFLRDVAVSVTWTDSKGQQGRVTLATSVAKRP